MAEVRGSLQVLISRTLFFLTIKSFDELEQLYERYNYKQMDTQELYQLIHLLLTDKSVFEHFFMYEVAKKVMGKK